jgi:hypothetical protein
MISLENKQGISGHKHATPVSEARFLLKDAERVVKGWGAEGKQEQLAARLPAIEGGRDEQLLGGYKPRRAVPAAHMHIATRSP